MDCPVCGEFNSRTALICCGCSHPFRKPANKKHPDEQRKEPEAALLPELDFSQTRPHDAVLALLNQGVPPERVCDALMASGIEEDSAVRITDEQYVARYQNSVRRRALGWLVFGLCVTGLSMALPVGGYVFLFWGPVIFGLARAASPGLPPRWLTPKDARSVEQQKKRAAEREPADALSSSELDNVHIAVRQDSLGTCLAAPSPEAGMLEIQLSKAGEAAVHGRLMTGDEAFDNEFVLLSNDPDLATAWIGPEVRRSLMLSGIVAVRVNNSIVTARIGADIDVRVRRAVAAVARGSDYIVARWNKLGVDLGGELGGSAERHDALPPIRFDRGKTSLTLSVARRKRTGRQRPPSFLRVDAALCSQVASRCVLASNVCASELCEMLGLDAPRRDRGRSYVVVGDPGSIDSDKLAQAAATREVAAVVFDGSTVSLYLKGLQLEALAIEPVIDLALQLGMSSHPYR